MFLVLKPLCTFPSLCNLWHANTAIWMHRVGCLLASIPKGTKSCKIHYCDAYTSKRYRNTKSALSVKTTQHASQCLIVIYMVFVTSTMLQTFDKSLFIWLLNAYKMLQSLTGSLTRARSTAPLHRALCCTCPQEQQATLTAAPCQEIFLEIRHLVHLLFIPKLTETSCSKTLIRRGSHPYTDSQLSPASTMIPHGQG